MADFNKNLRNELLYNDIQIKEFAGKINLPYSTVLSYLGTAERLPRVDIAVKMAQELGVSVEYLVTGKNSIFVKKQNKNIILEELGVLPIEIQKVILELIHKVSEIL